MGRPKMPSGEAGKPQPKDTDNFPTAELKQDTNHSVNDDFGYPLWGQYFDESKSGNSMGQVEPVDTDHDFYADWEGKEFRNTQTYPPFPAAAKIHKYSEETGKSGPSSVSQNNTHNHADDEDASGGGDDSEG